MDYTTRVALIIYVFVIMSRVEQPNEPGNLPAIRLLSASLVFSIFSIND